MPRTLVTGASGFLGSHIVRRLQDAGHEVVAASRTASETNSSVRALRLELADDSSIASAIREASPDVVVHCAAIPDLAACERDPDLARRVNTDATLRIAQLCADRSARLVFLSTDQVFAGDSAPYHETDEPRPLHTYGRTKLDAERAIIGSGADGVVLRIALVYGASPSRTRSSSEQILRALERAEKPRLYTDEFRTPVAAEDVAAIVAELSTRLSVPRLLHVAGPDRVSRFEFGQALCRAFNLDDSALTPARAADHDHNPPRPRDLALDTTLAQTLLSAPPRPLAEGLAALAAAS